MNVVFLLPNLYYCWVVGVRPGFSQATLIGLYLWIVAGMHWLRNLRIKLSSREHHSIPIDISEYVLAIEVGIAVIKVVLLCATACVRHIRKARFAARNCLALGSWCISLKMPVGTAADPFN